MFRNCEIEMNGNFKMKLCFRARYSGMIHDFVLLNALRDLPEVKAALAQASNGIHEALK